MLVAVEKHIFMPFPLTNALNSNFNLRIMFLSEELMWNCCQNSGLDESSIILVSQYPSLGLFALQERERSK